MAGSSHMILRQPMRMRPREVDTEPPKPPESCTSIHDLACTQQFDRDTEALSERRESAMERIQRARQTLRIPGRE